MMNGLQLHHESPKRRWDEKNRMYSSNNPLYQRIKGCGGVGASAMPATSSLAPTDRKILALSFLDDDVASAVVPPVTVVLEGRSICHRIQLDKHDGYESLAKALRRMFVYVDEGDGHSEYGEQGFNLSNAVPGYIVAYEDMEDDLLLAGDLNWKDFVRVAKRIRIIPAKASRRKHCGSST